MTEDEAINRIRLETDRRGRFRVRDRGGNDPRVISTHTNKSQALAAWERECRMLMGQMEH